MENASIKIVIARNLTPMPVNEFHRQPVITKLLQSFRQQLMTIFG